MAEYTYGKDFAIRTETDCIATENDFGQYVGRITAVKIKTNADRIRAMSDEELAEWFKEHLLCIHCPANEECHFARDCEGHLLKWLRKECDDT